MDPRTAQIGPSAEPSVNDLAWQLFGSRVGDQHAILIWVDAVDESDPVQGVGVGTGIVRAQALFDPLQFCFAAGGPDDLLDAHIVDAACPGVSCARIYIWKPPGVKRSAASDSCSATWHSNTSR
jgi:hypothetical protein